MLRIVLALAALLVVIVLAVFLGKRHARRFQVQALQDLAQRRGGWGNYGRVKRMAHRQFDGFVSGVAEGSHGFVDGF